MGLTTSPTPSPALAPATLPMAAPTMAPTGPPARPTVAPASAPAPAPVPEARWCSSNSSAALGLTTSPTPRPAIPPATAPIAAPAAVPSGPAMEPMAAPVNAPPVAPTPVATLCSGGSPPAVGSRFSATSLPARPPVTAPMMPPTTVPMGPPTAVPSAAPAAAPPAAPRPVPTGCEPGSPVMGSSFKSLPRSLAMMNAPEWVCDIKVGDTSDGFSVCCIGDASLLTAGCPACQRAPTARVRQSNGAAPSSTRRRCAPWRQKRPLALAGQARGAIGWIATWGDHRRGQGRAA